MKEEGGGRGLLESGRVMCWHGPQFIGSADSRSLLTVDLGDGARVVASAAADEYQRLPEGFAFAGFTDAHVHLSRLWQPSNRIDLKGMRPIEACNRLLEEGRSRAGEGWLIGYGVRSLEGFAEELGDFGHACVIFSRDEHGMWCNLEALSALGLGGEAPRILRDAEMSEARKGLPRPNPSELRAVLREEVEHLHRHGFCGAHEMATDRDLLDVMEELAANDELGLRVSAYLLAADPKLRERIEAGPSRSSGALLRSVGLKLFVDGALGSGGAWLSRPLRQGDRGERPSAPELVTQVLAWAQRLGWRVAAHAIGDRAARQALEWLRELGRGARIEHLQFVDEATLLGIAKAGLGVSLQPQHALSDLPWAGPLLHPDLRQCAYPWRSFLAAGGGRGLGL